MNVIQFTVPVAEDGSVVTQEDILPDFYPYLHRHKESQITLIIKGEGTLIIGNYSQSFKAGDVYVIAAQQPHIFKRDTTSLEYLVNGNIHAIHIYFNPVRLEPLLHLPEFELVRKFISSLSGGLQMPAEHASNVLKDIIRINELAGIQRLLHFSHLLHYLSSQVVNWKSLSTGFLNYSYSEFEGIRMNDVFQYTLDNYEKEISLAKIASIAHMTPHAFCKYFKKHTRKTYLSFLNEIRINEACKKMMEAQTMPISTIAFSTGFNSPMTFNRVFKKVMGLSPSQYVSDFKFKNDFNNTTEAIARRQAAEMLSSASMV